MRPLANCARAVLPRRENVYALAVVLEGIPAFVGGTGEGNEIIVIKK